MPVHLVLSKGHNATKCSNPREKFQKTNDSLDNLCVDKTNMDNAQEAILEQVPYIWYLVWFYKDEHLFWMIMSIFDGHDKRLCST